MFYITAVSLGKTVFLRVFIIAAACASALQRCSRVTADLPKGAKRQGRSTL